MRIVILLNGNFMAFSIINPEKELAFWTNVAKEISEGANYWIHLSSDIKTPEGHPEIQGTLHSSQFLGFYLDRRADQAKVNRYIELATKELEAQHDSEDWKGE